MVDAQLEAAFESESRAVLQLHAKLAPRRRREARELERLERDTARAKASVQRLQREQETLRRRHELNLRRLAATAVHRWWGWARLGRPLAIAALSIAWSLLALVMLFEEPIAVFASVAVFAIGAVLAAPPRRPGADA